MPIALLVLLVAFLLGVLLGVLLGWWLSRRGPGTPAPSPAPPSTAPVTPPVTPPLPSPPGAAIPDAFDAPSFAAAIAPRLAGTSADGAAIADGPPPSAVVWVDAGDELLVHLDSLQTRLVEGAIIASIDVETDQTGRTPLVVTFAIGGPSDPAGLIAVTDGVPSGNSLVASRWGDAVQAALWSSVLSLAVDHATERNAAPLGIASSGATITLRAGAPS